MQDTKTHPKSRLNQASSGSGSRFQHGHLVRLGFVCTISVAVLLRVFLTIKYANLSNPKLWEFGQIAENLFTTGVYSFHTPGVASAYMPPAFSLLIAFFYRAFGIGLTARVALATVLLVFEVAIPFLAGWVTLKIWNRKAGAVALAFALFWPSLLIMSGRLHSIPIYTALLILAFGMLFSKRLLPLVKACLVGLILGTYANFRYEAALFLLPFAYYIVRSDISVKKSRRYQVQAIAILLASFVIILTPWLTRNYKVFGKPLLSTSGGYNLIRGHHDKATGTGRDFWPAAKINPDASTVIPTSKVVESLKYDSPQDELIADRWYFNEAISYIKRHPGQEAKLVFRKAFYFLVADFTHPVGRLWPIWVPSLSALLVGLYFFVKSGLCDPRQQVLWMVFAIQLGLALIIFVLPRYRMSVDFVPLTFFSAWAATVILPRVLRKRSLKTQNNSQKEDSKGPRTQGPLRASKK